MFTRADRADPEKKNREKNREKKKNRAPGKLLRDEHRASFVI
jgi:hypothetical protein